MEDQCADSVATTKDLEKQLAEAKQQLADMAVELSICNDQKGFVELDLASEKAKGEKYKLKFLQLSVNKSVAAYGKTTQMLKKGNKKK